MGYTQLTLDFQTNKRVVDEIAETPSKRMRNKIAGFVTHLMKRIQRGPVRGISLKLQEEERERRLDFVPERSALEKDSIPVDADTYAIWITLALISLPSPPSNVRITTGATTDVITIATTTTQPSALK